MYRFEISTPILDRYLHPERIIKPDKHEIISLIPVQERQKQLQVNLLMYSGIFTPNCIWNDKTKPHISPHYMLDLHDISLATIDLNLNLLYEMSVTRGIINMEHVEKKINQLIKIRESLC
jgi:hypothetical protein